MSLIRMGAMLAVVVMLLPVDERSQAELSKTASRTAEQTATFCERNPSTCATGRELWTLFLRKAEYGMELGARLMREQLGRALTPPSSQQPAVAAQQVEPAPTAAPVRIEPQRRAPNSTEHAARWR